MSEPACRHAGETGGPKAEAADQAAARPPAGPALTSLAQGNGGRTSHRAQGRALQPGGGKTVVEIFDTRIDVCGFETNNELSLYIRPRFHSALLAQDNQCRLHPAGAEHDAARRSPQTSVLLHRMQFVPSSICRRYIDRSLSIASGRLIFVGKNDPSSSADECELPSLPGGHRRAAAGQGMHIHTRVATGFMNALSRDECGPAICALPRAFRCECNILNLR